MIQLTILMKTNAQPLVLFFDDWDQAGDRARDILESDKPLYPLDDGYGRTLLVRPENISTIEIADIEQAQKADIEMTVLNARARDSMNRAVAADPVLRLRNTQAQ